MDSFDTLRDALIKHLPRAAPGGPVSIDAHRIAVARPGLPVEDVTGFLAALTGTRNVLPEGLPLGGVFLRELTLERRPGRWDAAFDFTLEWEAGTRTDAATGFALRMGLVQFSRQGERLLGHASVGMVIDGFEIDLDLELPSQLVRGRLAQVGDATAAAFLRGRNLVSSDTVVLREFAIQAALPMRHVMIHLELENLFHIGPVSLSRASAELRLTDDTQEARAQVSATVHIALPRQDAITIDVGGAVDAHGWSVAGAVQTQGLGFDISHLVAALADDLGHDAPLLPAVIADLGLAHLAVALDTHDASFALDCTLDWGHPDSEFLVHIVKTPEDFEVSGTLLLNGMLFKVAFEAGEARVLVASFEAAGDHPLSIADLVGAFAGGGTGQRHSTVGLDVTSVALALDGAANVLMAANVAAGIDLSKLGDLPLFGALMPKDAKLGMSVTPVFRAAGFDDATLTVARAMLPGQIALPDTVAPNLSLAAQIQLGGAPIPLETGDTLAQTSDTGPAAPQPPGFEPASGAAPLDWTDLDLGIGPIRIDRAGYALSKSAPYQLDLALDGSLQVAGLTLALDGLGAHYDFGAKHLSPYLRGMSVDLKRGPLEIGGGFLNNNGDFAGKLSIGTDKFSLHAIAGFTMIEATPSMFAYGVLDMPLGGPVFFFVEGLAAGFGLHRHIQMPAIEDVHSFPLIAGASAPPPPEDAIDPDAEMAALHRYLSPKLGEYFFAAGVKFNSFRMLHGFGVVVVSMGDALEVDLIGTAHMSVPPELPPSTPALARVDLDLMARFAPSEGVLRVEARLNPKSYVYGPLCHLSGGFAFYAWFTGEEEAGDFVLSIGGYHPQFERPKNYPVVPRIEMKYQVSPEVYLKGDAYFALTPSVMMAGGRLHAQVDIGKLHAWADLSVDFIVAWEPFHYDARMHIEIGAKYRIFHTTATADLHIWGPKFSGSASIDWSIFSFEVAFGSGAPAFALPISVAKFKSSFLDIDPAREAASLAADPARVAAPKGSASAILGVLAARGATRSIADVAVVTAHELVISASSKVPVRTLTKGRHNTALEGLRAADIGAAPAGGFALASASMNVTVSHRDGGDVTEHFAITPVETKFPAALWAPRFEVGKNTLPITAISGLELTLAALPRSEATPPRAASTFWEARAVQHAPPARASGGILAPNFFQVVLNSVGENKIQVIKWLREKNALGLKEAKTLAETEGAVLLDAVPIGEAQNYAAELMELGADIYVAQSFSGASQTVGAAPADDLPRAMLAALGLGTQDMVRDPTPLPAPRASLEIA